MLYQFKDIEFFKVISTPVLIWYKADRKELRLIALLFSVPTNDSSQIRRSTGSPSYVLVVSIGRFIRENVWGI
jgi:hypothetical protein